MDARSLTVVLALGMVLCLAALAAAGQSGAGQSGGDPGRGEALYKSRCGGCHSLDANRTGPQHRGLFGRKAGAVAGFEYSAALKASTVVWDQATLDSWLADPQNFIPGQKMYVKVSDPADRADIIAYLKRASPPGAR